MRFLTILSIICWPAFACGDDFFESRIRPILATKCMECHGEDDPEGMLRLTSRQNLLKGGKSGPAVVIKDPQRSLLLKVLSHRGKLKMPPDKRLPESDISAFRKWISRGLPWPAKSRLSPRSSFQITSADRAHWSFQPLQQPRLPTVQNNGWCRTPMDRYILARLEKARLTPNGAADRRTILRRITYSLTGLPPTPREVEAFLSDKTPGALAKVVDLLLASPEYGVRWGRHWLDLVRYCDSRDARHTGQPYDVNEAWRYRDWVVAAFNRDLPYDQFVRLQIAGDCLVDSQQADPSGLIASGMLVIGEWGSGDADARKMYTDIVDDQIHVVSQAFLSLSITCARCHDHKFDPISTKDYYALAGIFFSTQIATPRTDAPLLRRPLATAESLSQRKLQQAKLNKLRRQSAQLRARIIDSRLPRTHDYLQALRAIEHSGRSLAQAAKSHQVDQEILSAWHRLYVARSFEVVGGPLLDQRVPNFTVPGVFAWKSGQPQPLFLINTTAKTVKVPGTMPPHSVAVHPRPTTGVGAAWRNPSQKLMVDIFGIVADAHAACGNGVEWSLELVQGRQTRVLKHGAIGLKEQQKFALSSIQLLPGDVVRLAIFPRQSYTCDLTRIDLTIRERSTKREWNLARAITKNPGEGNPHSDRYGQRDVWHFVNFTSRTRPIPLPPGLADNLPNWVRYVQAAKPGTFRVNAAFRKFAYSRKSPLALRLVAEQDSSLAQALRKNRAQERKLTTRLAKPLPTVLAAREGGVPGTKHAGLKDARVHIRGSYLRLGRQVPRRIPTMFGGKSRTGQVTGSGRVQLADWIASKSNPLTARVMANRIWLHHFGQGLVRTPGDFGRRGQPPTHPALLDYLARRLMQSDWSIKSIHRELLLSATFQQSSRPAAVTVRGDPENRFWSRMAIRRLDCEEIRDTMLHVAGVLDQRQGGPSIARYPGGYSRARFNPQNYNSKRRTLYLMSIRSEKSNGPFVLDAADPDRVVHQRPITTTAPQALFLLNNATVRTSIESLAQRIVSAGGQDIKRIEQAYRVLWARQPTAREAKLSQAFLDQLRTKGTEHRQVWQRYAHALLCTNEMIYLD